MARGKKAKRVEQRSTVVISVTSAPRDDIFMDLGCLYSIGR